MNELSEIPPPPQPARPPCSRPLMFANSEPFHLIPSPANYSSIPSPIPAFSSTSSKNHPPPPTTTSSSSAETVLSSLRCLIQLTEDTIKSVSTLLPSTASGNSSSDFVPCPFDPNHRLPPDSLFRHSLGCPSSLYRLDSSLLDSLNYPKTLQSSHESHKSSSLIETLDGPNSELCFSLDDYCINVDSNFFYRDCLGVVTSTEIFNGKKPMLRLPSVLAVECADFVGSGDDVDIAGCSGDRIKILASEMQFVRTETEAWNDYPTSYSYAVLRAILCSSMYRWNDLNKLILLNSPRYGIVLDFPMAGHIALLARLSLRAMIKEAVQLANALTNRDITGLNLNTFFNCPVLVEAMIWLVTQLSLLYGEFNGKLFAIDVLQKCLVRFSAKSSLFHLAKICLDFGYLDQNGQNLDKVCDTFEGETIGESLIYVSQVAAAVAALHERASLELKMKASQPLSTYQKFIEHENISKRADEERQKRVNYRGLPEHDGLFWQRSGNVETNKTKTREELLAEERDYKRRRMSYRGKKAKRSYVQVMRDIIDEYMEETKEAGRFGGLVKGYESATCNSLLDSNVPNKRAICSSDASKELSHCYDKRSTFLDEDASSSCQCEGASTLGWQDAGRACRLYSSSNSGRSHSKSSHKQ